MVLSVDVWSEILIFKVRSDKKDCMIFTRVIGIVDIV